MQKEIQKGNLVRIKKKSPQVGDGTAPIAAAFDLKASNSSISDLLRNVNPLDESFYKYIPKMFFEGENTPKKRYALPVVDSDGKALSAAQQDYFQDTVVRDKNGRLLTVYHGSPNVFTEFSHRFMNTNGNAHGRGFYFTDDAKYADGFKKDGGQLLKG